MLQHVVVNINITISSHNSTKKGSTCTALSVLCCNRQCLAMCAMFMLSTINIQGGAVAVFGNVHDDCSNENTNLEVYKVNKQKGQYF
jgi:hypothetical protein